MDYSYIHLQWLLLKGDKKNITQILRDSKISRYELYQLAPVILSMPATLGSVQLAFLGFVTAKIQYEGGNLELCNVRETKEFSKIVIL